MDHRRKWDRQEHERSASMALKGSEGSSDLSLEEKHHTSLEYLTPSTDKIDFDSYTSRTATIGTCVSKSYNSGGFHCSVCDIIVKDNLTYLDHVNCRRHLKLLGMSMKTRRSTFQEVRRKLRGKKNDSEKPDVVDVKINFREIEEENERMADLEELRKNKKQRLRKEETERELQEVMSFSNFVMNKKK